MPSASRATANEAPHGPLAESFAREVHESRAVCDVRFLDATGILVAELIGVETLLRPGETTDTAPPAHASHVRAHRHRRAGLCAARRAHARGPLGRRRRRAQLLSPTSRRIAGGSRLRRDGDPRQCARSHLVRRGGYVTASRPSSIPPALQLARRKSAASTPSSSGCSTPPAKRSARWVTSGLRRASVGLGNLGSRHRGSPGSPSTRGSSQAKDSSVRCGGARGSFPARPAEPLHRRVCPRRSPARRSGWAAAHCARCGVRLVALRDQARVRLAPRRPRRHDARGRRNNCDDLFIHVGFARSPP